MKKLLLVTALFIAANSFVAKAQELKPVPCATFEYMRDVQMKDPQFVQNQQILEQAYEYAKLHPQKSAQTKRIIPIVFHILHNGGIENIAKERVLEQVAILNKDFQRLNSDTNKTNPIYKSVAADCEIEFRLAQIDPNGNCTDGIVRVKTLLTYNADDAIKAVSRWPNNKYFNVWVVETISGATLPSVILGRSQFPGGSNTTDGVLLKYSVCGNTSTFSNYGRTLTHEIGHSLNLRHIWGDGTCASDFVDDTPPHEAANSGCPVNKVSNCTGNAIEMVENYMDYTDGICQNMFSNGQKARMNIVWNGNQNSRSNLYSPANLIATGTNDGYVTVTCVPTADFYRKQEACTNASVAYTDGSFRGTPTNWEWTFEGGTPAVSNLQNPTITYANAGTFTVKLKTWNATGADSITKTNFIRVFETVSTKTLPYLLDMEDVTKFNTDVYNKVDNTTNWIIATNAGFASPSSIVMKYYGKNDGQSNSILLPSVSLKGTSAPKLSFDYAYAQRSVTSLDRLQVGLSRNCGSSYSVLFNKAGAEIATAPVTSTSFVPNGDAQWKHLDISLTSLATSDNTIIRFLAENSGPGNNIYVDNIVITVATGMENLILNNLNLLIAPNPFNSSTKASFNLFADASVKANLYDLLGRKVSEVYSGQMSAGANEINISSEHTQNLSDGIYVLQLNVDGVMKSEKVLLRK
jgi:PKD repeat protein